ncbi:cellulase family glycosylhydrolase [Aquincola sp. MAHUQ-54]|uniref:Cellulase family glycosylhydrolase n=1 Tax=Aquincola agrisoli TaxID=3119538 RepID=A0AAW9QC35_9BURK
MVDAFTARDEAAGPSRRRALRRAVGAGLALAFGTTAQAAAPRPALRRGVNLTHWFDYARNRGVSPEEMQELARSGFDHVRLPFDPVVLGWRDAAMPDLRGLRAGAERAIAAGLDVVIDLHMVHETKVAIEQAPRLEDGLVALWSHVASAFADLPPAHVAFELYNEPQYYGWRERRWPALQRRLLAAVRGHAFRHLVLLTGARGGSADGLMALPPDGDPWVAYTFHFYLPYLFTHQGMDWLDERHTTAGLWTGIGYPASAAVDAEPRLKKPHRRAHRELQAYRDERWGPERIAGEFTAVAAWARRHGVTVVCNEFGVVRAGVAPAARYRWIGDVRQALEQAGFGWTVWDYADIFGIAVDTGGADGLPRRLEPAARVALGLRAAP